MSAMPLTPIYGKNDYQAGLNRSFLRASKTYIWKE